MKSSKLKGKIVENGLTQGELAKKVGISLQSLNAKLNNKASFRLSEAKIICDILKITDPKDIFFSAES